ncbi:MAG: phosphate ABC transporter permease subunit PstC [Candidatus Reconcilbacillus cellulovorans]|uniref:Phosphate transport system permease protein n=1 Tax=Candidatus Reconcilbacillus cellulovorans TaxID=1906605 RepID=A0A2A6E3N4_9BACL|nr:MAG: phosphate ABC transporter permease subunit PstC [Candidatus Reconcilbacillus cellulovorans]
MKFQRSRSFWNADRFMPGVLLFFSVLSVATTAGIVLILVVESLGFFRHVSVAEFLTDTRWTPLFHDQHFGVAPLVAGTLLVSAIATAVSLPVGLASAIYLNEFASSRVRALVKPALEVLAGVPTVVYGYFAVTFVTPVLQRLFPGMEMFNALSAGLVMGVMIIPIVCSLSEDAMAAVPRPLRDGAYALGATRLEVALRVVVPAAASGVGASFVLGLSRAVGETMIVSLAAGNLAQLTLNPLESIQAMTAYIVQVSTGDTRFGSVEYQTIYAVGFVLFVMTLAMNMIADWLSRKFREAYQ